MATGKIQISTKVLVETAVKMRNTNKEMDAKLKEINKSMNDLEADWKSDGATAIRSSMNALKPRFEEYRNVIESYAKFLDTTAQSYVSTETAVETNANAFK